MGDNFKVTDDNGNATQSHPSVSFDQDGHFVITWMDSRNGDWDIYSQVFLNCGNTFGRNFLITTFRENDQMFPNSKLSGNKIYTTWTAFDESHEERGIWANVFQWNSLTEIDSKSIAQQPFTFSLMQNHPNPFNPSTSIEYVLNKADHVTLKVYDINGKEIQTLVNEFQQADRYIMAFHPNDLVSGIYFYTLSVGGFLSQTKRMVILK
jgi:hypothetical protein